VLCRSNTRYLYWSFAQQLVHHSITGCNMRAGDLFGSGTISGPEKDSFGSLLELTWNGANPIQVLYSLIHIVLLYLSCGVSSHRLQVVPHANGY
jgi:2-keto-4-pentenoate hydratase/2-oxohepta-3-ene-1,7-dioic acid hydratase in catechol pathway